MRPEKLEDYVRLHDIRQKMFDMTSKNRQLLLLQKNTKKTDLLVAKLRKFTKYEGHGSSKFDRNRCRDRQTVFGNQNSI